MRLPLLALFVFLASAGLAPRAHAEDEDAPVPEPAPIELEADDVPTIDPIDVIASPLDAPSSAASPLDTGPTLRASGPVISLSGARLDRRRARTFGETLDLEPGVSQTAFGPGASRPVLRGLGGERVRITAGGLGTADVSGLSDDHAVTLEPLALRSIEVVRGPAVLRYGPNAIGGVVDGDDGRIPTTPIGRPVRVELSGRVGSADHERSTFARVEGQRGTLNWTAFGFYRITDDVDIPGYARSDRLRAADPEPDEPRGILPNSNTETLGGTIGFSHIDCCGYIGASVSWFESGYGVPGEAHRHEDEDEELRLARLGVDNEGVDINLQSLRFDLRGRRLAPIRGLRHIDLGIAYTDYEHTEFEEGETGTVFEQDTLEVRAEAVHCPFGCVEGAFGLQFEYIDFSALGEEAFVPPSETLRVGIYAFEEIALRGPWALVLAGRYDLSQVDADVGDRTFHAGSASVGVEHEQGDRSFSFATLSFTSRAPTSTELFADGPHLAAQAFEIGDPGLDLEQSIGLDVGYRRRADRVGFEAGAYVNWFPTFIDRIPTGDIDDDLPVFAYRSQEAFFTGFELSVWWRALCRGCHTLDVEAFSDVVYAENLDQDDPLPRIPPFRIGTGLVHTAGRFGSDLRLTYVAPQHRTTDFELATDGYTMLDAGVAYDLFCDHCGRRGSLFLRATNLLDQEARVHSSFLKDVAPLAGRNFILGFSIDL